MNGRELDKFATGPEVMRCCDNFHSLITDAKTLETDEQVIRATADCDYLLATDGSVVSECGGTGFVFEDAAGRNLLGESLTAGDKVCSYDTERVAMHETTRKTLKVVFNGL